jgi:hypothetical protein
MNNADSIKTWIQSWRNYKKSNILIILLVYQYCTKFWKQITILEHFFIPVLCTILVVLVVYQYCSSIGSIAIAKYRRSHFSCDLCQCELFSSDFNYGKQTFVNLYYTDIYFLPKFSRKSQNSNKSTFVLYIQWRPWPE